MSLKLTFPNGEHEAVLLGAGRTVVGTGSDCQVVLLAPGIALHHCELEMRGGQAVLHVPDPANVVVLNGKQATPETTVKAGDLLLFAKVGCQVMAAPAAVTAPVPRAAPMSDGDDGRTRIRQALPKFILRGVSGTTFGKTFALVGTMTAGRQPDCDIPIVTEEISRQHVRLQVAADGVMVEDLGSANGTFINDKRVHTALMKPGDELRLDTIRFMLMSPGMADPKPAAAPPPVAAPKKSGGVGAGLWIAISIGLILAGLATAHRFGVF